MRNCLNCGCRAWWLVLRQCTRLWSVGVHSELLLVGWPGIKSPLLKWCPCKRNWPSLIDTFNLPYICEWPLLCILGITQTQDRRSASVAFAAFLQCSMPPARKLCALRCATLSGNFASYSALFCLHFRLPTLFGEIQTSQLDYAKYFLSCCAGFSKLAVAFGMASSLGTAKRRTTFRRKEEWLWSFLKTGCADSVLPLTELHFMSTCVCMCVPSLLSRREGLRIYDVRWVRHHLAPLMNGESTVTKRTRLPQILIVTSWILLSTTTAFISLQETRLGYDEYCFWPMCFGMSFYERPRLLFSVNAVLHVLRVLSVIQENPQKTTPCFCIFFFFRS